MVDHFIENSNLRDDDFITGECLAARAIRKDLRDWVQEQLKDLIIEADLLASLKDGLLGDQIARTLERLRRMNQTDLREVDGDSVAAIDEVQQGGYTDIYEAFDQLQKARNGLVQLMREILEIRNFVGDLRDNQC